MATGYSDWVVNEQVRRMRIRAQAQKALDPALTFSITDAVHHAIIDAYAEIDKWMAGQLLPLKKEFEPRARKKIHDKVGYLARRSVSSAYGARVTRNQGPASRTHYRKGDNRLAGGLLRKAINDEAMVDATGDSIRFINWTMLDKRAAHWYRLNFGVGARGRTSRQGRYQMLVEGSPVGRPLGLTTGPSAHYMFMPPGFFLDAEGGFVKHQRGRRGLDAFQPGGHRPGTTRGRTLRSRITKGIEARNFLDAGVQRIAKELPLAYEDLFRGYVASKNRVSRETIDLNVPALRLRRVGVTVKPSRPVPRFRGGVPLF